MRCFDMASLPRLFTGAPSTNLPVNFVHVFLLADGRPCRRGDCEADRARRRPRNGAYTDGPFHKLTEASFLDVVPWMSSTSECHEYGTVNSAKF